MGVRFSHPLLFKGFKLNFSLSPFLHLKRLIIKLLKLYNNNDEEIIMNESKYEHIVHPFPPLYNSESRILILGSLPSVKSREQMFFYGHPQNRFWKMISGVFEEAVPQTIEEKKAFMLKHNIAMWDTIYSCDIIGSSDSSIKNVVPTDLKSIIDNSKIEKVICNGKTSGKYYEKYQMKYLGIKPDILPSTSPANAAYSLGKLVEIWKKSIIY